MSDQQLLVTWQLPTNQTHQIRRNVWREPIKLHFLLVDTFVTPDARFDKLLFGVKLLLVVARVVGVNVGHVVVRVNAVAELELLAFAPEREVEDSANEIKSWNKLVRLNDENIKQTSALCSL